MAFSDVLRMWCVFCTIYRIHATSGDDLHVMLQLGFDEMMNITPKNARLILSVTNKMKKEGSRRAVDKEFTRFAEEHGMRPEEIWLRLNVRGSEQKSALVKALSKWFKYPFDHALLNSFGTGAQQFCSAVRGNYLKPGKLIKGICENGGVVSLKLARCGLKASRPWATYALIQLMDEQARSQNPFCEEWLTCSSPSDIGFCDNPKWQYTRGLAAFIFVEAVSEV